MQVIYKNKDERYRSGRTNSVGFVIHAREISRYLEEKYFGGFEDRKLQI